MTRKRQADTAKLRDDREGERFSGAGAFGDGSIDKSRDRPEQGRRGFSVFGTMIPKSGNRFLEKDHGQTERCRPNRVLAMRLDRLGEG
ncbi:hypothetical protein [Mesorhizobium sp.]|uniref:hypothetical protein n=1 Tax=Mesorhizobium sp. TaxID=1871066 RepID=UPI000FE57E19|nr:hypothetical protein [Mesorhizobium sp.]RWQ65715.1 MAG: hypothetical protein EOS86_14305 [Mesorhizobium sp.]